MSSVRVLVGTRKGAFIITADGARKDWNISAPFFGGWELYHLKGSPVDPNRIYASQGSGWFGQLMQRSNDGGKTWEPVDNAQAAAVPSLLCVPGRSVAGSGRHAPARRRRVRCRTLLCDWGDCGRLRATVIVSSLVLRSSFFVRRTRNKEPRTKDRARDIDLKER